MFLMQFGFNYHRKLWLVTSALRAEKLNKLTYASSLVEPVYYSALVLWLQSDCNPLLSSIAIYFPLTGDFLKCFAVGEKYKEREMYILPLAFPTSFLLWRYLFGNVCFPWVINSSGSSLVVYSRNRFKPLSNRCFPSCSVSLQKQLAVLSLAPSTSARTSSWPKAAALQGCLAYAAWNGFVDAFSM